MARISFTILFPDGNVFRRGDGARGASAEAQRQHFEKI